MLLINFPSAVFGFRDILTETALLTENLVTSVHILEISEKIYMLYTTRLLQTELGRVIPTELHISSSPNLPAKTENGIFSTDESHFYLMMQSVVSS